MTNKKMQNNNKRCKEVAVMPTIEAIEYERVAYIKEMNDYLQKLKNMQKREAKEVARKNLVECNILQEDGEYTARYAYTRMHMQAKR